MVIFILGFILWFFGGTVQVPKMERGADGEMHRVMTTNAEGEEVPVLETKNKFLQARNLTQIAKDTSFIAIMAIGATFIIISGGIDLSVGAIYALASVVGAIVFNKMGADAGATGALMGMLACIGVAVLCGAANGGMSVLLKVHPFIITLGTMAIFRGIAFVVTDGQSIGGFPEEFRKLVLWDFGSQLSIVPLLVTITATVVGWFYLSRLAAGRRVFAVGGNETASRYSGIRVNWVKFSVFVIAGFAAGISALLALGYYGAASSADGAGYELNVIAAAVVGGASLTGGRGSALGAVLGALIIQMITTGIVILGIDQNYSQIVIGAVVVLAVVLDQFNTWIARRRLL